jgi:hypothetical protein
MVTLEQRLLCGNGWRRHDSAEGGVGPAHGVCPTSKRHRPGAEYVYEPHALAAGSGCSDDLVTTDPGRGGYGVAHELALLPGSTVLQPATLVQAFGREAEHLRLRIDDQCPVGQAYRVTETSPGGSRGITYGDGFTAVVMEIWIIDLGGSAVVVDTWHQHRASADLVNQVAAVRDSVTFVTGLVP